MFALVYLVGLAVGMTVGGVLAFVVVFGSSERTFPRLVFGMALIAGGGYAGFVWCVPILNWLLAHLK